MMFQNYPNMEELASFETRSQNKPNVNESDITMERCKEKDLGFHKECD